MFTDEAQDAVEFSSCWRTKRRTEDSSTQTSVTMTYDKELQTTERDATEVQTDPIEEPSLSMVGQDIVALKAFLDKVVPDMCAYLDANSQNHAFDGYDVEWEEQVTNMECTRTLSHDMFIGELQCTSLSWSCTGSVLAVAYGRFDHEDLCTHKAGLCTWNLDRRLTSAKRADFCIDTSGCLLSIAFHPNVPSFICGGTFHGEIIVWNLANEDELQMTSTRVGQESHQEPVTDVTWIPDMTSKGQKFQIVSCSIDGKVLIWQLTRHNRDIQLVAGHDLLVESVPRSLRFSKTGRHSHFGATCMSFSPDDCKMFVVGCENGGLFKCAVNKQQAVSSKNPRSPDTTAATRHILSTSPAHRSPITFAFRPQAGPVYGVDCSPFHRNLFLSCGTDSCVHIYTTLQARPVVSLEPGSGYLFAAQWSPSRPLVFAAASNNGQLLLFDLQKSRVSAVESLEASKDHQPVYTLEFNKSRNQLLATGDGAGKVRVWRLQSNFTKQSGGEVQQLEALANIAED